MRVEPQRGSAAVEFALVVPLVLILALALVQVGLLTRDRLLVEAASRAGAREAAVTPDDQRIVTAVQQGATGIDPSTLTVAVSRSGSRGDRVSVKVTLVDVFEVPFVGWLMGTDATLVSTTTMRQEFG